MRRQAEEMERQQVAVGSLCSQSCGSFCFVSFRVEASSVEAKELITHSKLHSVGRRMALTNGWKNWQFARYLDAAALLARLGPRHWPTCLAKAL